MVSVEEAQNQLFSHPIICEIEQVPLEKAMNRILAEAILADRDFPPYNRVAMDGIALNFKVFQEGQQSFLIESTVAAGQPQYHLRNNRHCVEIMTGAVLPIGCDSVIRYEDIKIDKQTAILQNHELTKGQNVHVKGSDRKIGSSIVSAQTQLSASHLGIAATVGKSQLPVFQVPRICLVSTGDELVGIDEVPAPHQIRSSNAIALRAILEKWHTGIDHKHIGDNENEVRTAVAELLKTYQIIIFMGGSSMGKFDFIPSILKEAGLSEYFYRIMQRPGKPMWFGGKENQFVFALPGNPVSCFLCAERYVDAWLRNSLGLKQRLSRAILKKSFEFKPPLTYFLQVKLTDQDGCILAEPIPGSGSGDHANLADTDAFLELPAGRDVYHEGEKFRVFRFKSI